MRNNRMRVRGELTAEASNLRAGPRVCYSGCCCRFLRLGRQTGELIGGNNCMWSVNTCCGLSATRSS